MHFKAGLLAAVAAAATVSAEHAGQNQINIHRQFEIREQAGYEKICVTKQPITACQAGFVPQYNNELQQSVEVYCLDKTHPMARHQQQMTQIMETGHNLKKLQQESEKRTIKVSKVQRCKTAQLTTEGQVEDDSQLSQHQRNKFHKSQEQREQQYETIRAQQTEQLQKLQKQMPTIVKAIQMSDSEYEQAFETLAKIARKDQQIEGALYNLQAYLPHAFVQAVQRVQHELTQQMRDEQEQKRVSQQLKKLSERVYLYVLTRLHEQEQKLPIREQVRNTNNKWEQFEKYFERVWNQIKFDEQFNTESIERQIEQQVRKFEREIEQEQQQQLKPWELYLQQQQQHVSSWEQEQEQQQQQQQPQQWENKMNQQQREKQQQLLTKIIMKALATAQTVEKMQKEQPSSPLFSLNKQFNYEQLNKQVKKEFYGEF